MKEIIVDSKIENLGKITAFIESELEAADCPLKAQMQIDVAVDEIASNVCFYAYGDAVGELTVRFDYKASDHMAEIAFIDSGKPYNPLENPDPDITLAAEERQVGGLGLLIVKKSMDEVFYEYKGNQNILTIRKKLA